MLSLASHPLRALTHQVRQFSTSYSRMSIKVGDAVPSATLYEDSPAKAVDTAALCAEGKVLLFAVPGAFTPGCSLTHLPGYIKDSEAYKEKGVKEVVCVSVNDPFVMGAWGKEHQAKGKVRMLADPEGSFTSALGLGQELAVLGGLRSKRYSMLVEDGKVTQLNVEPDGKGLSCSLSVNTLPSL